ncbi:hypothetical protein [Gimesia algae]|uniref:Uncharacterized protein n=1 Tax=Gimesia algae TaxID=2527971 RepID=A0A517VJB2_9PLAN|nr:hypothetical protein [Gimesia algae]QDT93088.1 hypothetical protein Pan161_47620 [Gimesia algae]
MMIQNKVRYFKRPFRMLLSLALVVGICSAPLMAADKSSDRKSRSSSRSSQKSQSSSKSSRPQRSTSRPQSFTRPQTTRPKSSSTSKSLSRPSGKSIKNFSGNVSPKVNHKGASRPSKSFKVTPQTKRPDFKMPQFGKQNGIKLDTKHLNPRIPDRKVPGRKVPNLKIPEYKRPDRKIPNHKIPDRKVPDRKTPNLKVPDRKVGPGKFVPKPGKNTKPSQPGFGNNVFKPGKGKFDSKPGKGNDIFKPGNGNNVFKPGNNIQKPGKKPHQIGKLPKGKDLPGHKDFSKGKQFGPSKKWLGKNGVPLNKDLFKNHSIKPLKLNLDKQLQAGKFNALINSKNNKQWKLKKQFELHKKGDVARQLKLNNHLLKHGGWRNRTLFGNMANSFTHTHFGCWYAGPGMYPSYCWSPHWSAWVDWCWWDWCHPICDPRPLICRPIICDPCVPWVWYDCPVWQPLPIVTCGTWVDIEPIVIDSGLDLQMLAVRFVDSGHPEEELGPRFRVWFRNNSVVDINQPFNVMLLASNSREAVAGVPEAGTRVDNIAAGQIQSVDIRLPFAASTLSLDAEGNQVPFEQLHVLIDSHREIPEAFEENNGSVVARVDVLPVDPALFSADSDVVFSGGMVNLAGEGLGPEPGKVLMSLNGMNFEAEIYGWYDLGVRIQLPELPLLDAADATFVIVRGDGAASNPLDMQLAPQIAAVSAE